MASPLRLASEHMNRQDAPGKKAKPGLVKTKLKREKFKTQLKEEVRKEELGLFDKLRFAVHDMFGGCAFPWLLLESLPYAPMSVGRRGCYQVVA